MKLVSLTEFKNLTGLDDSAVIVMLEKGELPTALTDDNKLRIDLEKVSPEFLGKVLPEREHAFGPEEQTMLEESVASEVVKSLESMVDDALELAFKWHAQKESQSE